jgi:hypothetical protein
MSAALKNVSARTKRAKLIAAMGLVNRNDHGFNVKSPTRNKDNFRVWRDDKGRVRCSCAEFEGESKEDPKFRCEHILAVKYHLEPPTEAAVQQAAAAPEAQSGGRGSVASQSLELPLVSASAGKVEDDEKDIDESDETEESDFPSFSEILKVLSNPIPRELIRQRVGWTDRSGHEHEIDYIEWHTVADMLDRVCPNWSHSVRDMRQIGDLLAVTASITICGVTREGVGTGSAYDEKGIKKAEHDALKRAAVKFGIARELYKKDEDDTNSAASNAPLLRFPRDPVAKNESEVATSKQLAAIRAIANAQGIDPETECTEVLSCRLEELSRRAASAFIDYLKSKQLSSADEVRQVS